MAASSDLQQGQQSDDGQSVAVSDSELQGGCNTGRGTCGPPTVLGATSKAFSASAKNLSNSLSKSQSSDNKYFSTAEMKR